MSDNVDIVEFLESGSDFEVGLALLESVMPNPFYIANIRRKGAVKGLETVKYELKKRVKTRVREGERGRGCFVVVPPPRNDRGRLLRSARNDSANDGQVASSSSLLLAMTPRNDRFRLRDEFPFLKNDDCPEEFKVLVADMITAHAKYIEGHERLYYVANKSDDECFVAAETVVENYLENRWIWEELEHYKKTGTILGNHRIFTQRKRQEEIEKMEIFDLMKMYRNLPRSVCYYKTKIAEDGDSELTQQRKEKIDMLNSEYKIVKRLLHIHDAKQRRKKGDTARKGRRR